MLDAICFLVGYVFESSCGYFGIQFCGRDLWVYNFVWWIGAAYVIHMISAIECDYCNEAIGMESKWFRSPPINAIVVGK